MTRKTRAAPLAAAVLALALGAGPAQATEWAPAVDDPAYEYWSEIESQLGDFSQFNDEEDTADAGNTARTVQLNVSFQIADCLTNCTGQNLQQTSDNTAATTQGAAATATATQTGARNYTYTKTLFGGVVQRNDVAATALAANDAVTIQRTFQVQVGCLAFCTAGVLGQTSTNTAVTTQSAAAIASGTQTDPENEFVGMGGKGTVAQYNTVAVDAAALNQALIRQRNYQIQVGCRRSCLDIQMIQAAVNQALIAQDAAAKADGTQVEPLNVIDVGGGTLGGVKQINAVVVTATATNEADVSQRNRQWQFGCIEDCRLTSASQTSRNSTAIDQTAEAEATGTQVAPRNEFNGRVIVSGYGSPAVQVNSVVEVEDPSNTATVQQSNESLQDAITTDEVEVPEVPALVEEDTMGEE